MLANSSLALAAIAATTGSTFSRLSRIVSIDLRPACSKSTRSPAIRPKILLPSGPAFRSSANIWLVVRVTVLLAFSIASAIAFPDRSPAAPVSVNPVRSALSAASALRNPCNNRSSSAVSSTTTLVLPVIARILVASRAESRDGMAALQLFHLHPSR